MKIYKYMRALDNVFCPMNEKCSEVKKESVSDRLKKMIEYSAIFFSDPLTFNDPFDGHFSMNFKDEKNLNEMEIECDKMGQQFIEEGKCTEERVKYMKKCIREQFPLENYRVSCFSGDENNELLWAHYADQHRGVILCYEFDSIEHIRQKKNDNWVFIDNGDINSHSTNNFEYKILLDYVKYSFGKPQMEFTNDYLVKKDNLREALFTKSVKWSYEKEIRLALEIPFGNGFSEGNHYIILDKSCLKSVVFGKRLENHYRNEIKDLITESGYENVSFIESVIDTKTFSFKQKEYN